MYDKFIKYVFHKFNDYSSNIQNKHIISQPPETTLNSPIIVGHSNFLKLMLILRMVIYAGHVNFQPTLNFLAKKLAWATFTNFIEKYFGVDDFTQCYFNPAINIQLGWLKSS